MRANLNFVQTGPGVRWEGDRLTFFDFKDDYGNYKESFTVKRGDLKPLLEAINLWAENKLEQLGGKSEWTTFYSKLPSIPSVIDVKHCDYKVNGLEIVRMSWRYYPEVAKVVIETSGGKEHVFQGEDCWRYSE